MIFPYRDLENPCFEQDLFPFRTANPAIRTNFAGPDYEWRLLRRLTVERTKTSLTSLSENKLNETGNSF
jgi:hypothetical protein